MLSRYRLNIHWNGGRDTIEPLLRYCELKGYRDPAKDNYGWARMAQVLGNFFGSTNCVGIMPYTDDECIDPGDNGIYVIDGWRIVERVGLYDSFVEQHEYDFDRSMPEGDRLSEFLNSVEVPVDELQVGDEVSFPQNSVYSSTPLNSSEVRSSHRSPSEGNASEP